MTSLVAGAAGLESLVPHLARAEAPVIIRSGMANWDASLPHLLERHSKFRLKVSRSEQLTNGESREAYRTSLAEFSRGLQSGAISAEDYVFNSVGNRSMAPELGDLFARANCLLQHEYCSLAPRAARGNLNLIYGGHGSANGWHSHGPALNGLLAGAKLWAIVHPDLGTRWDCWQTPGDLIWVPDGLPHAIHENRGVEVVALATQMIRPGMPPLAHAAFSGLAAEVQALLDAGAPVDTADAHGSRPLHAAAFKGHRDVAATLLKAGAVPARIDARESPPLHLATLHGHLSVAKQLLRAGAPVDDFDSGGSTALHAAAATGQAAIVRLLLAHRADASLRSRAGGTALVMALAGGSPRHREAAEALRAAGATP